jgi:diadenylate cyclase
MFSNFYHIIRSYEIHEVILEMAVIWIGVYFVFRFLRGTRGAGVIKGVAVLLIVLTLMIRVFGQATDAFGQLNFIYERFLGLLAIVLIVVFQPELRQAMIRLGQTRLFRGSRTDKTRVVKAISEAVEFLSKSQFGAIIAIERSVKLGGLIERGQGIDGELSKRLLESIFWPNSPLHDLGVVVRGDRIVAAGVQFPLVESDTVPPHFGSRHRAALGLALETDCIVVVVSEENGAISIAEGGNIEYDIPRERFAHELTNRLEASPVMETFQSSAEVKPGSDEKQAA